MFVFFFLVLFFTLTSFINKSLEITGKNQSRTKADDVLATSTGIAQADISDLPFVERNRMHNDGTWFYPNRGLETGAIHPNQYTITNLLQGNRWNLTVGLVANYNVMIDFKYSNPDTDGNCDMYLYPPSVNLSDPATDLESGYIAISTLSQGVDEAINHMITEDGNYSVSIFHNPAFSTQPSANGILTIKQVVDDIVQVFYTEGEVTTGVVSNYSDFYWLYPFTADPIYADIPLSVDSLSLHMVEISSDIYEETSGNPGEDLYIANDTFSGNIGAYYRSQTGRGFVSLWGIHSGESYQVVPLQSSSRTYSQTDLNLKFFIVTEGSDPSIDVVLNINGEEVEESIDYSVKKLSNYLSLVTVSLSSNELDQGSIDLELTSDYSFDFQINGYGNYFPIQSEVVYYQNTWNTTQNSTLIYAKINENETTIENVTFNFKNLSAEWHSIPMTWIEPTVYAANISSDQLNVTTVEWNLTLVETASLSTQPVIKMEESTENTEVDLAESTTIYATGSIEVHGISALNAAITITSDGATFNTSTITFGEILAGSSRKFGVEITFDGIGSVDITFTLTADNHPGVVDTIRYSVTDTTPVETTTTMETATTTTTTTASQAIPGFTIFTLMIIGCLLVSLRRKTK